MKKFDDIDFYNLTPEEMRALPPDYMMTWTMRPNEKKIEEARKFMYMRAAGIAISCIYVALTGQWGVYSAPMLAIIMYEIFYYDLSHKKLTSEYHLNQDQYNAKVAALDLKHYYSKQ